MASLFSKLRTLFKAKLHESADAAIRKNSMAVYDEYIRQAEREVKNFVESIAPMYGQVKTTKRRREALAEKAAKLDLMIDMYLRKGKRTEALVAQKQFTKTMELIATYDMSLERQVTAAEKLHDIRIKLEGRLAIAKAERDELAYLLKLAKSKEKATKAMKSLDNLAADSDSELAGAAEAIRSRLDHADAAWEVEVSDLDDQLDDALQDVEVESELAARMERLGIE